MEDRVISYLEDLLGPMGMEVILYPKYKCHTLPGTKVTDTVTISLVSTSDGKGDLVEVARRLAGEVGQGLRGEAGVTELVVSESLNTNK